MVIAVQHVLSFSLPSPDWQKLEVLADLKCYILETCQLRNEKKVFQSIFLILNQQSKFFFLTVILQHVLKQVEICFNQIIDELTFKNVCCED